jgi:hypothetical protein
MDVPTLLSRITEVTVFRCGALIRREAEVAAPDGVYPQYVRLTGLPLCIDGGSVRVSVASADGDPRVLPVASDLQVSLDVPDADPSLAPPRDEELREAEMAVRRLEDQAAQVGEQISRVEQLSTPDRPAGKEGEPPPPSPQAGRLALLEFRQTELDRLSDQLQELHVQRREADERLRDLRDRELRASSARQAREDELRKSVVVRLRSPDEQKRPSHCRLAIEYAVPGATWAPAYTVRFEPDYSSAAMVMRAVVRQKTAENWDDVNLTLSTADPQSWTDLPALASVRIGRRQPASVQVGWRPAPADTEVLFEDYDRGQVASGDGLSHAEFGISGADTDQQAIAHFDYVDGAARDEEDDLCIAAMEAGAGADDTGYGQEMAKQNKPTMVGAFPPPAPMYAAESAPVIAARGGMRSRSVAAPNRKMARRNYSVEDLASDYDAARADTVEMVESSSLSAKVDLLNYRRLRLTERGKLEPGTPSQVYTELLAQLRVSVSFDVLQVVQRQVGEATSAFHAELPKGFRRVGAWDGFDSAYRAEARVDVPSDDQFHSVPLLDRDTATSLSYVLVPREATDVFRFVRFVNPLEAALPEGPADIYVGGDFLLTTPLHTVAPGGDAELGLGVEEAIKVARNTRFAEHKAGMLGGDLNLEHEITIELTNHLSKPAVVEVRERIPTMRDDEKDIQLQVLEVTPPWESLKQTRRSIEGGHRWRVEIQPGAKQELMVKYQVSIAAKNQLVGGNRREQ